MPLRYSKTNPDGSVVYIDDANPQHIVVNGLSYGPATAVESFDGGTNFKPISGAGTTAHPNDPPADLGGGLSDAMTKTQNDYVDNASKAVGAVTAATGLLVPSAYGFGTPTPSASAASGGPYASGETGMAPTDAAIAGDVPPASVAAPGSSSGLPNWLNLASDVGKALGAASTGAAAGRNADNNANIGFAQAQNNLYKSELAAPGQIAGNAVRGDILSNARDVSLAAPSDIPVPTISGGLRPSAFSDTTRQLGKNITSNAATTPMPVAQPPVLQPFESAGVGSDILNTAGILGSLAKPGYDIWKMFNNG